MIKNNIYTTYKFMDRTNNEILHKLTVRSHVSQEDTIKSTLTELVEKYSLAMNDILIEE